MELAVKFADSSDLPRINELRAQVSALHAAGRPALFRPVFNPALQARLTCLQKLFTRFANFSPRFAKKCLTSGKYLL